MICIHCSTPIPDDSQFCMQCGADVSDPSGATTASLGDAEVASMVRALQQEMKGEYEIEREIGRGGMAVVYLAREIHLRRKVAIKVLPPELTFGSGAIQRFQREAQTAAGLDHPNIIPIYRVSSGGRLFWYAMKYVEGRSLDAVLKEKERLSLEETIEILDQVADALDYAHERNVIHRDIKPANIMLEPKGRVIVTDFGIAKALTAGSLTASGSAIGTPCYMSPEQFAGGELSGAADLYSVGIMTYLMLSGQLPFEADSPAELLHKHCLVPPPPLDVLRPALPANVYSAVNRALAKKAPERFPTVTEFVEALKWPQAEISTTELPKRSSLADRMSTQLIRPATGRRKLVWRVGVAVVLATGAGGLWWWTSQTTRPVGTASVQELDSGLKQIATTAVAAESLAATQPQGAGPTPSVSDTAQEPEPSPAAPQPTTGRLALAGLPPEAMVLIDDQVRRGTSFDLSPGLHEVRVVAPGFEPAVDTVLVVAGAAITHRVSVRPRPVQPPPTPVAQFGVLVVRTMGGWARIYVDGALRREGRTYRDTMPVGPHRLRLERPGYITVDTTVTLEAKETRTVTIPMRRRN